MKAEQAVQPDTEAREVLAIRPARIEDAEALARLSGQLGYPSPLPAVERRLAQLLDRPGHAVFVAEHDVGAGATPSDPQVIGWIHAFGELTIESDATAELGGIVVDEAWRGRGAGRLLIERAEQWAREAGCVTLTARTNILRERAHAFYQSLGYSLVKNQRVFRKSVISEVPGTGL